MNAIDKYRSLTNTRKFLLGLAESTAMPHGTRSLAQGLLGNYPTEEEINVMVSMEEDCREGRIKQPKSYPVEFSGERGGWIFWDETWTDYHGPFTTRSQAEELLNVYCRTYLEAGKTGGADGN